MLSFINETQVSPGKFIRNGYCLSTDTLPIDDPTMANGSMLLQMDISNIRFYTEELGEWIVNNGGTIVEDDSPKFVRPTLIYGDYIGICFRLKLPKGKTVADYPNSYVKFASRFYKNSQTGNEILTAGVNANSELPIGSITADGTCHIILSVGILQAGQLYTPTFYYTEDGTDKSITGKAWCVGDVLKWEIDTCTDLNLKNELKCFADFCYYHILYDNASRPADYTPCPIHYTDSSTYPQYEEIVQLMDPFAYVIVTSNSLSESPQLVNLLISGSWGYAGNAMQTAIQCLNDYQYQTVTYDGEIVTPTTSGSMRIVGNKDYNRVRYDLLKVHTAVVDNKYYTEGSLLGYYRRIMMLNHDRLPEEAVAYGAATYYYCKASGQL